MYYLRTTQKILNTSKLKPDNEPEKINPAFEWYGQLCPTGYSGKMLIVYVHSQSKIAILARGKSLLKTQSDFLERLELLLIRNGFDQEKREKIIPSGNPLILKTNSRSVLGFINNYIAHLD